MTDADTIVIGDQIAGPVVAVGVLKREHDESIAHARPLANTEAAETEAEAKAKAHERSQSRER
eukprot:gene863-5077_t